MSFLVVYILL